MEQALKLENINTMKAFIIKVLYYLCSKLSLQSITHSYKNIFVKPALGFYLC